MIGTRLRPLLKLAAGIFFLVLLALLGGGVIGTVYYESDAERNIEQKGYDVPSQPFKPCIEQPPVGRQKCLVERESAKQREAGDHRSNAREEYGLAAQRIASLWTAIMGVVALLGIGLSALGAWLVFTTFRETQRTAQIAEENLRAFRDAERGHCEIKISGGTDSETSDRVRYIGTLRNTGRTPIKVLRVSADSLPDQVPQERYAGGNFAEVVINPDCEEHFSPIMLGSKRIDKMPFIGGFVEYRCKFHQLHRTYFCYHVTVEPPSSGFVISASTHRVADARREKYWPLDS